MWLLFEVCNILWNVLDEHVMITLNADVATSIHNVGISAGSLCMFHAAPMFATMQQVWYGV